MASRLPSAAVAVALATVAVWLLDPWSVPALLLGVVLGAVLGMVLVLARPDWFDVPVEGPVAGLRRRQPWTEPRFAS